MVRTVNICMAIGTLSETDDSGNIPWRCVAADGVGVNECKYPETKLCKRVGSMWGSWRLQESKCAVTRRRIGMSRRQVFSCAPVIY